VVAVVAIVAFARQTSSIITDGDFAVTELYTELATRGQLFVGPYSRFGWHHPGPLYFYLQAPFYALGGHRAAALYATVLGMNFLAIVMLAWVVARHNQGRLLVLVTGACVLFAWRAPRFLASPWTAHVPVLPSLAFIVLCAAVASGQRRLLPLTLFMASFILQTHVGFVPMVGALLIALLLVLIFDKREKDSSLQPIDYAAVVLCLALWLPTIGEAIWYSGGNVAALWRFFVTDAGSGHTFREAAVNWSYGLTGVLRPDFELAWGGHFVLRYLWWGIPGAIGQVLLLALIAWRDLRAGRRFEGWLALSSVIVSAMGLVALMRIRDDILDHELFWLAAFGALNLGIIAGAGFRAVAGARPPRPALEGGRAIVGCIAILLLGLAVGVHHLWDFTAFELRRRQERRVILTTYDAIQRYVRSEGIQKPLINIEGPMWGNAAGVLLRLIQDRTPVAVASSSVPMFTEFFLASGIEDATITIGGFALHQELRARPSNTVLLEFPPVFVDAIKGPSAESR
jgi:hypothetical protein